jgi:hypothetical protein
VGGVRSLKVSQCIAHCGHDLGRQQGEGEARDKFSPGKSIISLAGVDQIAAPIGAR